MLETTYNKSRCLQLLRKDESFSHNAIQFLGNCYSMLSESDTYCDLIPNIGVSNELGINGDREDVFMGKSNVKLFWILFGYH